MSNSFNTPVVPLLHITLTAALLDCLNQMSVSNDKSLNCFIPDLIAIAAERANELVRILEAEEKEHA